MSALKQTDVFASGVGQNRAVASEIAGKVAMPGATVLAASLQNHTHQQRSIIQRKPGEDEELPIQRVFINNAQNTSLMAFQPIQRKENNTGMPDNLKTGLESMSGFDLSDVKVHYNSSKPAQLQAFGYAQGNDIHLGPGQEKHLPHEGWHVVQQRQGRVTSTVQLKGGANVNDNPALEHEADPMGHKKEPVKTDFGEFNTPVFKPADKFGVDIMLTFTPYENKVDAIKIGLSQSVKHTLPNGKAYPIDPNSGKRMVAKGRGAGYNIDRPSDDINPLYSQNTYLKPTDELSQTPEPGDQISAPKFGRDTNYKLGQCPKVQSDGAVNVCDPAGLYDKPRSGGKPGESMMFETTALAIAGVDKNKYYGSVKWGFIIEETKTGPKVKPIDITRASAGTPTPKFIEPAKLWNKAKSRGTLKVAANPYATVLYQGVKIKMPKGTELIQIHTEQWNGSPALEAGVLNADGTVSEKIIKIKNADVVDQGDGMPNIQLPIPNMKGKIH